MAIELKLTVFLAGQQVAEESYQRDIVKIGRLASAHLKLDDPRVSRIHAVIEATTDGAGYSVIDMGSADGTFVNGDKVSKQRLADGDEIVVGDSRIVVGLGAGASALASTGLPPPPPVPTEALWTAPAAELAAAQATGMMPAVGPEELARMISQDVPVNTGDVLGVVADPYGGYAQAGLPQAPMAAQAPVESQLPYPQPVYETAPPYGQVPYPGIPQGIPVGQVPLEYGQAFAQPFAQPHDAWGAVPNNLASEGVPDTERELEIKTLWGSTVLESVTAFDQPQITMGDERKVTGFGPFQKFVHCDIEIPSKGLPVPTYALAEAQGRDTCNYVVNIPAGWEGQIERADGSVIPLQHLREGGAGAEAGDQPGAVKYHLRAEETLYIAWEHIVLQLRYIRRTRLVPPPFFSTVNYTWMNTLVLAFFIHLVAVVSFVATPRTQTELTEDIFKNPNRFAQFRLTPEEKKKALSNSMLAKLQEGAQGAKAKGKDGKAGRKDHKSKDQGRMAVKGQPDKDELAKGALDKLFGNAKGDTRRSYLFGSGGLGGELKGALGGVTGAQVGDATGLGGLGSRGSGPGGGGRSMNSVGLGALGTHGRGGGGDGTGYGEGAAGLGAKADRDINISAGSPIIMGSLDKEIIRRVIKQHLAQIRYCYEKELVRAPGLFGKVGTQFTIAANGLVQAASVTETTLKNSEVERCITAKIRTWKFPKPKGGGVVIVKYPFIFKTSG